MEEIVVINGRSLNWMEKSNGKIKKKNERENWINNWEKNWWKSRKSRKNSNKKPVKLRNSWKTLPWYSVVPVSLAVSVKYFYSLKNTIEISEQFRRFIMFFNDSNSLSGFIVSNFKQIHNSVCGNCSYTPHSETNLNETKDKINAVVTLKWRSNEYRNSRTKLSIWNWRMPFRPIRFQYCRVFYCRMWIVLHVGLGKNCV